MGPSSTVEVSSQESVNDARKSSKQALHHGEEQSSAHEDDDPLAHSASASRALREQDYDRALGSYRRALDLYQEQRSTVGQCNAAATLHNMALLHKRCHRYSDSVQCFQQAEGVYRTCCASIEAQRVESPEEGHVCLDQLLVETLHSRAFVHSKYQDNVTDAIACHELVVEILLGMESDNDESEREPPALPLEDVVFIKMNNAQRVALLAESLKSLGVLYFQNGDTEEALAALEEALEVLKCQQDLDQQHVQKSIATVLIHLASVYFTQEDFPQALEALQEAFDAWMTVELDAAHPDVLATVNNMGLAHERMGNLDKALECYEDLLHVRSQLLGEDHVDVAESLATVAKVLERQGNAEGALDLFQEALRIYRQAANEQDPSFWVNASDMLCRIAFILLEEDHVDDSIDKYREALQMQQDIPGESSEDLASLYHGLGRAYMAKHQYAEARECLLQSARLLETVPADEVHVESLVESSELLQQALHHDSILSSDGSWVNAEIDIETKTPERMAVASAMSPIGESDARSTPDDEVSDTGSSPDDESSPESHRSDLSSLKPTSMGRPSQTSPAVSRDSSLTWNHLTSPPSSPLRNGPICEFNPYFSPVSQSSASRSITPSKVPIKVPIEARQASVIDMTVLGRSPSRGDPPGLRGSQDLDFHEDDDIADFPTPSWHCKPAPSDEGTSEDNSPTVSPRRIGLGHSVPPAPETAADVSTLGSQSLNSETQLVTSSSPNTDPADRKEPVREVENSKSLPVPTVEAQEADVSALASPVSNDRRTIVGEVFHARDEAFGPALADQTLSNSIHESDALTDEESDEEAHHRLVMEFSEYDSCSDSGVVQSEYTYYSDGERRPRQPSTGCGSAFFGSNDDSDIESELQRALSDESDYSESERDTDDEPDPKSATFDQPEYAESGMFTSERETNGEHLSATFEESDYAGSSLFGAAECDRAGESDAHTDEGLFASESHSQDEAVTRQLSPASFDEPDFTGSAFFGSGAERDQKADELSNVSGENDFTRSDDFTSERDTSGETDTRHLSTDSGDPNYTAFTSFASGLHTLIDTDAPDESEYDTSFEVFASRADKKDLRGASEKARGHSTKPGSSAAENARRPSGSSAAENAGQAMGGSATPNVGRATAPQERLQESAPLEMAQALPRDSPASQIKSKSSPERNSPRVMFVKAFSYTFRRGQRRSRLDSMPEDAEHEGPVPVLTHQEEVDDQVNQQVAPRFEMTEPLGPIPFVALESSSSDDNVSQITFHVEEFNSRKRVDLDSSGRAEPNGSWWWGGTSQGDGWLPAVVGAAEEFLSAQSIHDKVKSRKLDVSSSDSTVDESDVFDDLTETEKDDDSTDRDISSPPEVDSSVLEEGPKNAGGSASNDNAKEQELKAKNSEGGATNASAGLSIPLPPASSVIQRRGRSPRVRPKMIDLQETLEKLRAELGNKHPDVANTLTTIAILQSQAGNGDASVELLLEALDIQKSIGNRAEVALVLHALGDVYSQQEQFKASLACYSDALGEERSEYGFRHPAIATTLNKIGTVHASLGEFDIAMSNHQHALKILKDCFGEDLSHPLVAQTLICIGAVYYKERNSLATIRAKSDDYSTFIEAGMLDVIARAHEERGSYRMAIAFFEEKLQLLRNGKKAGMDQREVAGALIRLGNLSRKAGVFHEAMDYYDEALKIKSTLRCDEVEIAEARILTAAVLHHLGQFSDSLELLQSALSILKKPGGSDQHALVAEALQRKGMVHIELCEYYSAMTSCEQALEIQKKVLGEDHPATLRTRLAIAIILMNRAEIDSSIEQFTVILETQSRVHGPKHPNLAETMYYIARAYEWKGDVSTSMKFFEESFFMAEEFLGHDHPVQARTLHGIADLQGKKGRHRKALQILATVLSIRKETLGETHIDVALTLCGIAYCQAALGRFLDAVNFFDEALPIAEEAVGEAHPSVAHIYVGKGSLFLRKCHFEEAREWMEKGLEVYRWSSCPANHPRRLEAESLLERVERDEMLCV